MQRTVSYRGLEIYMELRPTSKDMFEPWLPQCGTAAFGTLIQVRGPVFTSVGLPCRGLRGRRQSTLFSVRKASSTCSTCPHTGAVSYCTLPPVSAVREASAKYFTGMPDGRTETGQHDCVSAPPHG